MRNYGLAPVLIIILIGLLATAIGGPLAFEAGKRAGNAVSTELVSLEVDNRVTITNSIDQPIHDTDAMNHERSWKLISTDNIEPDSIYLVDIKESNGILIVKAVPKRAELVGYMYGNADPLSAPTKIEVANLSSLEKKLIIANQGELYGTLFGIDIFPPQDGSNSIYFTTGGRYSGGDTAYAIDLEMGTVHVMLTQTNVPEFIHPIIKSVSVDSRYVAFVMMNCWECEAMPSRSMVYDRKTGAYTIFEPMIRFRWIGENGNFEYKQYILEDCEGEEWDALWCTVDEELLPWIPGNKLDAFGWKTYRNEEYGFEFMYPSDWQISRSSSLGNEVTIVSNVRSELMQESESEEGPLPEIGLTFIEKSVGHSLTDYLAIDDWYVHYRSRFDGELDGKKMIRFSDIGEPVGRGPVMAVFIEASPTQIIRFTLNDNENDGTPQELIVLNQILRTFEFIEPTR